MNELDRFALHDVPRDWDDVLRRARIGRPRPRLLLAAAAVALVAAAAPAAALVGVFSNGPQPVRLTAALGGHGALDLLAPRAFVAVRGRGRVVVPFFRGPGRRVRREGVVLWHLRLDAPAERAVLRGPGGRMLARLCGPCKPDGHGLLRLRLHAALATFNGKVDVVVRAGGRTLRSRLELRRRR